MVYTISDQNQRSSARQKGRTGEEGCAKKARMSAAGMSGGPQSMPMSSGMAVDAGGVSSEGSDLVGVGIVFQPTDDGTLYVKRMKPGQPAERSGLIYVGDCLCEINGRDVFRQPGDLHPLRIIRKQGFFTRLLGRDFDAFAKCQSGKVSPAKLQVGHLEVDSSHSITRLDQSMIWLTDYVSSCAVEAVKNLLLGPAGTAVRLGFHRGTDPRSPLVQVALQRCLPGQQLVGVGIIFRSDASGALYVRQLQERGAADLSGQVHIGDCVVEVDGNDVFRKPISTFTNMMLGPPNTIVTLGFKRASSGMVERVMLRRAVPARSFDEDRTRTVVHDTNIKMRMELEKEKEESRRLREILSTKKERVAQLERTLERGTSAMGGQMNDETQRLRTFDSWPHSEATHAGVTPRLLASDGFFFNPTAQDPDTVMCFFCDLQLGDWERSDDCKAVHRKLSPNCPHVLGLSCGNIARSQKAGSILPANATPQARLEDILARKATLLQAVTSLELALDDARRQIYDAVQARRRLQQEAVILTQKHQGK